MLFKAKDNTLDGKCTKWWFSDSDSSPLHFKKPGRITKLEFNTKHSPLYTGGVGLQVK